VLRRRSDSIVPKPTRADLWALALLSLLFMGLLARSWLAWGHITVDYGREMWVPLRLLEGDVLYRDVRYPYGPFSPYLHSLGYRLWAPHLGVLYGSGIAFTMLCWLACYGVARQLGSVFASAVGTALVMTEAMFVPGRPDSFNFVFPYAYPALHGLAFFMIALAGALRLQTSNGRGTAVGTGLAIGLTLLTKQEFGAIAVLVGVLAAVGLVHRDGSRALRSITALGVAAGGIATAGYGVLALAVSPATIVRRGLFDPSYFGWPITWTIAGFRPGSTPADIARSLALDYSTGAAFLGIIVGGTCAVGFAAAAPSRRTRAWTLVGVLVATLALGSTLLRIAGPLQVLRLIVIPAFAASWLIVESTWFVRGAVRARPTAAAVCRWLLAVAAAVLLLRPFAEVSVLPWLAWLWLFRYQALPLLLMIWLGLAVAQVVTNREAQPSTAALLRCATVAVALVMLSRVLNAVVPGLYANFYLAPALLLWSLLLLDYLPRCVDRLGGHRLATRATGACALLLLAAVAVWVHDREYETRNDSISTVRGTLRLPANDPWFRLYRDALAYLVSEASPGATLLALPTETSLYFLSGHDNHFYETSLVIAVTTDAAERAYVRELKRDSPDLVLASTQQLLEYGRGVFGVHYGRRISRWIESHYTPGRILGVTPLFVLGTQPLFVRAWRRAGPPAPEPHRGVAS